MEVDIIKIGNSKGIRIPSAILKACKIQSKVEIEVKDNIIQIKPSDSPRKGWEKAFKQMHQNQDDELLIKNSLDNELLEEWNEN